jgi:hypothetical protein
MLCRRRLSRVLVAAAQPRAKTAKPGKASTDLVLLHFWVPKALEYCPEIY